jgi:hypothetical protein
MCTLKCAQSCAGKFEKVVSGMCNGVCSVGCGEALEAVRWL